MIVRELVILFGYGSNCSNCSSGNCNCNARGGESRWWVMVV